MTNRVYKRLLLGLGLDCNDGHIRITRGKNFRLYGGSKETHELMQEKAVKLNKYLEKQGVTLDDIELKEFQKIARKIGLKVPKGLLDKDGKGGSTNGKNNS